MILGPALGPGREFDLIRRLVGRDSALARGVILGPGDDAAVLEEGWVVSTDLFVEDVHFRRAWIDDAEVGYRATAAALSDLAAMGATPVGVLLSMGLPEESHAETIAVSVQEGARAAADAVGASVIGGDLARSPGPLLVDVVVLGRTSHPVLRSGARPGDALWVTGTLGAAAAAVERWRRGAKPEPMLRRAFTRPVPRVEEMAWLRTRARPTAAIDLSDGLAGDAGHLAAAAGHKVVVESADVPLSRAAVEAVGAREALRLALHGGEDYEILLSAADGEMEAVRAEFERTFTVPLTRVGRVDEGQGVWLSEGGGLEPVSSGGFDHFTPAGA